MSYGAVPYHNTPTNDLLQCIVDIKQAGAWYYAAVHESKPCFSQSVLIDFNVPRFRLGITFSLARSSL